MTSPYENLPAEAFWRSSVAETDPAHLRGIWTPKFGLSRNDGIMTAGSCFAQHIGRALKGAGLNILDVEPPPVGMRDETARRFGYGLFSARYGNIYTTRQLLQLLHDALEDAPDPSVVWEREGRFFDALRPGVEPDGLARPDEVLLMRQGHLARVAKLLSESSVLIFTLGLTEAWRDRATGRVWPTAPGVIAGAFDPKAHEFVNFRYAEIIADLTAIRAYLKDIDPSFRMILTVSPVPLTATASGDHVLSATTRSKAVLRAAAGDFAEDHDDVDYFPSYELVTNQAAEGRWFDDNRRSVTPEGVEMVMRTFLAGQGLAERALVSQARVAPETDSAEDELVCEELLLQAFEK